MASRKNKVKKYTEKEKRKLLKSAGFLEQDLRKNPTPQQKSAITKKWNRYGTFVKDGYVSKKLPKKQAALYKEAGYLEHNGRVFVNKEGYDRVYFGKEHITKTKKGKKKKDILLPADEILPAIEKRLSQKQKKGEYLTLKIGDNGTFGYRTTSFEELEHYIKHVFKAQMTQKEKAKYDKMSKRQQKIVDKKMEQKTQELISQMSIVTVNHRGKATKKK